MLRLLLIFGSVVIADAVVAVVAATPGAAAAPDALRDSRRVLSF
jgi:hypothetical protein